MISNISTIGTTWSGGNSSDSPVTHSIEAPKPLYPLMMAPTKMITANGPSAGPPTPKTSRSVCRMGFRLSR